MKNLKNLAIITIALFVFFNGCKKDEYEATVFLCPQVVSTIPIDKAIDIPLNQVISVTFNDKMDPETINQVSFIIQQGSTSIAGTVAYSGLTATFTPSSPLLPGVLYSGTINTMAKDSIGQSLMEDYKWSFTTISEVTLSSNPTAGGTTSGAGTFRKDSTVIIVATANEGYSFINWTLNETPVSTYSSYQFTMDGNKALVANFTLQLVVPIDPIVTLGTAGDFSILTKSGISTTGITSVQGNIGVSPAAASAITGFDLIMDTDGQSSHTTIATLVTGKVYASDYAPPTPSKLTVAVDNMETAYTTASNLVTPAPVLEEGAGNISGLTLAPGLYKWSTGVLIDPDASVTLSGGANDTWVFQIAQDLTLMSKAQVKLLGGAQAKNITWVVAGQAVLGTESELYGTIMSKTLISLNTGSKVTGRLLAQTAVTLNTSTVVEP